MSQHLLPFSPTDMQNWKTGCPECPQATLNYVVPCGVNYEIGYIIIMDQLMTQHWRTYRRPTTEITVAHVYFTAYKLTVTSFAQIKSFAYRHSSFNPLSVDPCSCEH